MRTHLIIAGLAMAGLTLAACEQKTLTGQDYFTDYCAACHGANAKGGDGVLDSHWPVPPSDLTTLSRRHGGVFPTGYVMSTIDGYTRGTHDDQTMPQFGPLLEGEMAVWTDDNGIPTPTPEALLQLAHYIETLQE